MNSKASLTTAKKLSILTLSTLMAISTATAVNAEDRTSTTQRTTTQRTPVKRVPVSKRTVRERTRTSSDRRRPQIEMDEKTRARIEKAKRSRGTRGGTTTRRRPGSETASRGSRSVESLQREVRSLREEVKRLRQEVKMMGQAITATRKKINEMSTN